MNRFTRFLFLAASVTALLSCHRREHVPLQTDTLRFAREKCLYVALENNFNDYFLFNGQPMGFGLEMLEGFSKNIGCDLVILPCQTLEEQWRMLEEGRADLIASNLNITEERTQKAAFTHPIYRTGQVLVQLDPLYSGDSAAFVQSMEQLAGKTVNVRRHSVFEETLRHYNDTVPPHEHIKITGSSRTEEELLHAVSTGRFPYTMVSQNKAFRFKMAHPQIDISLSVGETQDVAWALHPQSDSLLALANRWIDSMQKNKTIGYLYHKYYEIPYDKTVRSAKSGFRKIDSVNRYRKQIQWERLVDEGFLAQEDSLFFFNESPNSRSRDKHVHGNAGISPFDRLIKKYSRQVGWDWQLLASLIYQESQFRSYLVSSKGAIGLMQLMPPTARQYGITVRSGTEEQIAAGVRYLKSIYRALPKEIPEQEQRYFVLGAYNIGLGHILDARRLAQKHGADPNVWHHNVEDYLLLKSKPEYYRDTASRNGYANGKQAVDFVRKIETRAMHYRNLTK
ncbi:MAG: transporter substrate-binding domain-containing protein [Bacteroides sp.]|nr:transporter substrate-binding domain-containing protein [Ruminococcus flavefaciens]MCM1554227.1 transporter substrate-binding domain-containing protein [Bacteroides sp.]